MEDIIKSVKAFLYDRSASPLFGAFLVSWVVWNYRFIIYIISDVKIDHKIQLIDSYFSTMELELFGYALSIPSQFTNGFIAPAVFAFLYIYVYPYLAKPVYRFSLKRQSEIRTIKQQESDTRLLDAKESREILQRLAELQEKYNSDTDNLQSQVSSLSITITELEKKSGPDLSKVSDKELEEMIESNLENNLNKEESNEWDDAGISKIAYELIMAAASDNDGTIMKRNTLDNTSIQAGGQQFGDSNNREYAMYEAALNELLKEEYVKSLGDKDEIFALTHAGWELAGNS